MTSSLASQLAAVRTLNAARLSGRPSSLSTASYLFPPRTAAAQDLDSVHALAANGWADLCAQEPQLLQWTAADEILGEASRTVDRITLAKHENKRIDDLVRLWLHKCAPVLLSKPAAKCIEWLVRRFRIHEFSPLDVLSAFMPYHSTPQFARILSLCKIDDRPHLAFLLPFQKRVEPVPASVIVAACLGPTNGPSLDTLRFLAALVTNRSEPPHRALIAFWTGVLAQLCLRWSGQGGEELSMGLTTGHKRGQHRSEEHAQLLLSVLLPAAVDVAADSKRMGAQTQLGGLMLLCTIAAAFPLSAEAARSVLSTLLSSGVSSLSRTSAQALLAACYALAASAHASASPALDFATPEDELLLPAASLKALTSIPDVAANVVAALDKYDVSPFLEQLLGGLVRAPSASNSLLTALLDKVPIELLISASHLISTAWLSDAKDEAQGKAWLSSLARIRQRQPKAFDAALSRIPEEEQGRLTMSVLQAHVGGHAKDLTWLRINDSSVAQRKAALKQLLADAKSGKVAAKDAVVQDMLVSRLADEDQVLQVLYGHDETLQSALGDDKLAATLTELLADPSVAAATPHLDYIVRCVIPRSASAGKKLFLSVIWPRLSVNTASSAALHRVLARYAGEAAPADGYAKILHDVGKQGLDADDSRTAATIATHILESPNSAAFGAWLSLLTSQAKGEATESGRLLSLQILHALVGAAEGHRLAQVAQRAAAVVSHGQTSLKLADDGTAEMGPRAVARHLAALLVQTAGHLPLQGSQAPFAVDAHYALGSETSASRIARTVYGIAISHVTPAVQAQVLSALFSRLGASTLALLASMWCQSRQVTEAVAALASLKHAQAFVRSTTLAVDFQAILPAVLLGVTHPTRAVRSAAVELLSQTLTDASPDAIFGLDSLYGPKHSDNLRYAETDDVRLLTSALLAESSRLESDGSQLTAVLAQTLSVSRADGKKAATSKRSLVTYLVSHVVSWPSTAARADLLDALSQVSDAAKLAGLRPLVEEVITKPTPDTDRLAALVFAAYDRSSRSLVEEPDSVYWSLLSSALASPSALVQRHAATAVATSVFAHSKPARAVEILEQLALIATAPEAAATPELARCIAGLKVDAAVLLASLSHFRLALVDDSGPHTAKKARTSDAAATNDAVPRAFNAVCFLLESALGWSPHPTPPLVAEVFDILRTAVESHGNANFNAEQLVQPAMSLLAALLSRVPADEQPAVAQVVRADIAVNVIKASANPQTFSQALLLLSSIAGIAPDAVLHNAMSIFTFVGSTMLQRDDGVSFNVVQRTLKSVVPPLVASIRHRLGPAASHAALIRESRPFICVFTDAATHVPRHRRDVFFRLLVDVLGVDDFLSAVVMLLTDRIPRKVLLRNGDDDVAANLALPLGLLASYPADKRIAALAHIWDEISKLEELKDADLAQLQAAVFLDPMPNLEREHGPRGVDPVASAVALVHLVRHAVSTLPAGKGQGQGLSPLIRAALRLSESADANLAAASRSALSATIVVVPVATLAELVVPLLADPSRRSGALDMFASKLDGADAEARQAASSATPQIVDACLATLGQDPRAFAALTTIARSALAEEHAVLAKAVPALIELAAQPAHSEDAYAVLVPLATTLGPRLIAHLSALVSLASSTLRQLAREPELRSAALANHGPSQLILALLASLPVFMQSHLPSLVALACDADVRQAGEAIKCGAVFTSVARRLPFAQVLDALSAAWSNGDKASPSLHLGVLDLVQRLVRVSDRSSVASIYKAVFRFLLRVLDLRREGAGALSAADLSATEDAAVACFVRMVLKLNESTFRPLFLRLYDWAALDLVEEGMPTLDPGLTARRIALYKTINALLDSLQGLVAGYYATALDLSLEILAACNEANAADEDEETLATLATLATLVSSSINKSARHDEGNLWNPTRLEKTLSVLLSTLCRHGRRRESASVDVTCDSVCRIARAVGDEGSLKLINSRLLSRARATGGTERLAVVQAARRFWSQGALQNALLGLVPETVPFVSELLDSEEEETLEATNGLVNAIEEVLGESLDAYLQ